MLRFLSCATAVTAVLVAPGVLAQVTPEEVWQDWQSLATLAGQELAFDSAIRNGDRLEVSGLVIRYKDDLGGSLSADMGRMTFADNGDGTVSIVMAESYPVTVVVPAEGDSPITMQATVTQTDMVVTVAGTPADASYELSAASIAVTLDEVTDTDSQPVDARADLVMTDLAGRYRVQRDGDTARLETSFTAAGARLDLSGTDGDGAGTLALTLADLAGTTSGRFLGAGVIADMAAALNAGFAMDSTLSFGAVTVVADVDDVSGPVNLAGGLSGGSFDLALDKDRLSYSTAFTQGRLTVSGPAIPLPEVVMSFAETGFGFRMPVSKSDRPQDFSVMSRLVDVTISDDVWNLLDPTAALSREPASFIFDIKGRGLWTQDIMDPTLPVDGVEPPGQLTALDLAEVLVKAAGTEVGATGGLTFDNSDPASFGGMLAPAGSIALSIKGANKLIDNLIAMGLLQSEDAMGARMMMGLFARPGAGPDELTSVIEFRDGGIFANGQQLQ